VHKRVPVDNRHTVIHPLVGISDVGCAIDSYIVVNIRDLNVGHASVGDVYVLNITRTRAIPRNEDIAGCQRKPANTAAYANTQAKAPAAYEGHQRRRIDGSDRNWSWNPAPSATCKCPTSIVEGCESPRLIFYPRPAPRPNISPMSEPIRGPSVRHANRRPHIAV